MKSRRAIFSVLAAALLCICLPSCESEVEQAYAKQAENIDRFVSSQLESNPSYKVYYNDGVVRLVTAEGSGPELEQGGMVKIHYIGYLFNSTSLSNSNIFVASSKELAAAANWSVTEYEGCWEPEEIILGETKVIKGLELGLEGVKAGEDCIILFTGKYGYGKDMIGTIPANTALAYRVIVTDVSSHK